jgi:hypothetical protein
MDLFSDFTVKKENPEEFQELVNQLCREHNPIGKAEQLEVERIAVCWWRLNRAWRYENAEILGELGDIASRAEASNLRHTMPANDKGLTVFLEGFEEQIEASGEISSELQEEMFNAHPSFQENWENLRATVEQKHEEIVGQVAREVKMPAHLLKEAIAHSPVMQTKLSRLIDLVSTKLALDSVESRTTQKYDSMLNFAFAQRAIPKPDAADRLLRYEAAIERNLSRALDRLERLQRRRRGELVPPSVNMHLTR